MSRSDIRKNSVSRIPKPFRIFILRSGRRFQSFQRVNRNQPARGSALSDHPTRSTNYQKMQSLDIYGTAETMARSNNLPLTGGLRESFYHLLTGWFITQSPSLHAGNLRPHFAPSIEHLPKFGSCPIKINSSR